MATANVVQTSVSGGIQNALALQGDGVFFPKVSTASRLALTLGTSDAGFTVYDSQVGNLYFWTGTAWQSVPNSGSPGLNGQVQYNNNGTVQGATGFTFDNLTNAVSMGGDLTVRTNKLFVNATGVGINYTSPAVALHLGTTGATNKLCINTAVTSAGDIQMRRGSFIGFSNAADNANSEYLFANGGALEFGLSGSTAMTLNSAGLGVGVASPTAKLDIAGAIKSTGDITSSGGKFATGASGQTVGFQLDSFVSGGVFNNYILNNASAAGTNATLHFGRLTSILYGFIRSDNNTQNIEIGTAGTARLIIDQTGNVGVGGSPAAAVANNRKVEIVGTINSAVVLSSNSANASARNWAIISNWNAYGDLAFQQSNALGGDPIASGAGTTRMTLDASGNLLVGTTTNTNSSRVFARGTASSSALALQGATGDVALAQLTVGKFDNNTTTSQVFVRFTINDNSGGSGQINANGASQAAFGSFSDSRLKDNIVSLPSQLANILSLRPVEFDYKDGSGHQIGFVAQEMQEVYSDAVGEQNGFLTVTGWSKTEARLVSAIKELAAKVQALEAKLA